MLTTKKYFLFLIFLLLVPSINAKIPSPTHQFFVNDYANLLTDEEEQYLLTLFSTIEKQTSAEIVLVIVQSLEGYSSQEYATQIGQTWGVGKKDTDNGLVILYAINENKIFAATGHGLEGILPDSKIGRMLDQYYVPQRDNGNPKQGILDFAYAISQEILINKDEIVSKQKNTSSSDFFYDQIISFLVIICVVVIIIMILASSKISIRLGGGHGGSLRGGFGGFRGARSGGFRGGGGSFGGGGAGR
ncbi:MAG: TPM domain-containing protein [Candidatus Diapherotrites archaeon]